MPVWHPLRWQHIFFAIEIVKNWMTYARFSTVWLLEEQLFLLKKKTRKSTCIRFARFYDGAAVVRVVHFFVPSQAVGPPPCT